MVSRTADGKHTKRFIIEYFSGGYYGKWIRSGNMGHSKAFASKEEAQAALTPESTADGFKYRIRQK